MHSRYTTSLHITSHYTPPHPLCPEAAATRAMWTPQASPRTPPAPAPSLGNAVAQRASFGKPYRRPLRKPYRRIIRETISAPTPETISAHHSGNHIGASACGTPRWARCKTRSRDACLSTARARRGRGGWGRLRNCHPPPAAHAGYAYVGHAHECTRSGCRLRWGARRLTAQSEPRSRAEHNCGRRAGVSVHHEYGPHAWSQVPRK